MTRRISGQVGAWAVVGALGLALWACDDNADVILAGGAVGPDAATGGAGGHEAGPGPEAGACSTGKYAALEQEIEQLRAEAGVFGMAMAVIENGEICWTHGFGRKNAMNGGLGGWVLPTTMFRSYLLGESLNHVLALNLFENGQLALDTPVLTYLPSLHLDYDPNDWLSQVTTRHLLTYSHGLRYFPSGGTGPTDDSALAEWASGTLPSVPAFPGETIQVQPGLFTHYSIAGSQLLGLVGETASGTPFRAAVKQKILQPLGMTRTVYTLAEAAGDQDVAISPISAGAEKGEGAAYAPVGGPLASIEDMAKFVKFLLDGDPAVLSDALREQALSPQESTQFFQDRCAIGFAWEVDDTLCNLDPPIVFGNGMRSVYWAGDWTGFNNFMFLIPDKKFAVVGVTNDNLHGKTPSLRALLEPALHVIDIQGFQPESHPEDPAGFGRYVGTYVENNAAGDPTVTVTLDGQSLHMSWTGSHACDLSPSDVPRVFTCQDSSLSHTFVQFIVDGNDQATYLKTFNFIAARANPGDGGTGDAD